MNAATAMERVCVMSGGDEVRYRAYVNHAVYAQEHGFIYHIGVGIGPGVTSPYYYKFNAVREILPHFDWVLYLDDDVYITALADDRVERLIAEETHRDDFLVIAEGPQEPDGSWTRVNSGVMLVKNDPRSFDFLARAQSADLRAIGADWDEESEGLFTNGDQDAIWRQIRDGSLENAGVRIAPHRWLNSRSHYYSHGVTDAFAVHFCGPGDKTLKIAQFGRRFGLGQELVPDILLDRYSVRRRERMAGSEMCARRLNGARRVAGKRVRRKIDFLRTEKRWR